MRSAVAYTDPHGCRSQSVSLQLGARSLRMEDTPPSVSAVALRHDTLDGISLVTGPFYGVPGSGNHVVPRRCNPVQFIERTVTRL